MIDPKVYKNRDVIVTTSLSLVIFSTVVFGSTVGLLQKYLFPENDSDLSEKSEIISVEDLDNDREDDLVSVDLSSSESSYEEITHPNQ
mgnify:CR=1 FL=1